MVTVRELRALLAKLNARRERLVADLALPIDGLPGSFGSGRRECGTSGCHCHEGEGHLSWTLTFMSEGKKRVEHVPNELVEEVGERVERGNAYKDGVAELFAINARCLVLERRLRRMEASAAQKRGRR
jgi:hypothetical protein